MNLREISKEDFLIDYVDLKDFYVKNSANYKGFSLLFFLVCQGEFYPDESFLNEVRGVKSVFREIPREEIWNFWSFWANSSNPGDGLLFLRDTGVLEFFPELFGTIGVMQNPKTHPEGDVFTHMMMSVDEARHIVERESIKESMNVYEIMFGSLCHDLGKQITYGNHDSSGSLLARRFLLSIGAPTQIVTNVSTIVNYHMADYSIDGNLVETIDESYVKWLENSINPVSIKTLYFVHESDKSGRLNVDFNDRTTIRFRKILNLASSGPIRKFTYKDLLMFAAEGVLPEIITVAGESQNRFIRDLNRALDNGYVSWDNIKSFLKYSFNESYLDGLLIVDTLDYRSKKKLVDYMNDNNLDVDDILLKGKSGIEKILNTPSD